MTRLCTAALLGFTWIAGVILVQAMELQFRKVDAMGAKISVPYNTIGPGKDVTIMFIAEKSKLRFLLNTALTILKYSQMNAFSVICLDCSQQEKVLWTSKGLHIIESKAWFDVSLYAFRADGPMSHTSVLPTGDKRRHSIHMYYRESIKFILLEHKLSVFLVDIDVCMKSSIRLFMQPEDIVVSATWPKNHRPGQYSFLWVQGRPDLLTELNNGLALFTPTPAYMKFQRQFMGIMVHEVVADFGFAQTAFQKLMSRTNLTLHMQNTNTTLGKETIKQVELVGKNDYGVTVRAVKIGYHPAGVVDWAHKESNMKMVEPDCWLLPTNWEEVWNKARDIQELLQLVAPVVKIRNSKKSFLRTFQHRTSGAFVD